MADEKETKPDGWRPEWRKPKERQKRPAPPVEPPPVAPARARETPALPPLPADPAEMAAIAKRVLLDIAENGGGPDAGARVGAAKALLEQVANAKAKDAPPDLSRVPDHELGVGEEASH